jgi:hypothetical protein
VSIPHSDCTNAVIDGSGNLTCTGKGSELGSNPPLTVTDPVTNETSEGSVPLNVKTTGPTPPLCTADPLAAQTGAQMSINCTVDPGTTTAVQGTNAVCTPDPADATGKVVCTGTAGAGTGQINSNPTVVSDDGSNTSTNTVNFTVDDTPPSKPTCTASPLVAQTGAPVQITCTVEVGTTNTIPGASCTPNPADTTGKVVCSGTAGNGAGQINSSPTVTSADPAGNVSTNTVTFAVNDAAPSQPQCTANPPAAQTGKPVSITCTVDAGSTNTVQGTNAVCNPDPADASGQVVCTGTAGTGAGQINSNPTVVSSNGVNTSSNTVTFTVDDTPPIAPQQCSANPNPAKANQTVIITCTVEAGTTTSVPGATSCTTVGTNATCTGSGGAFGKDPTVTSTDLAGNTNSTVVPLNVLPATNSAQPIPSLSGWSLITLALMLLGMSAVTLRRSARR